MKLLFKQRLFSWFDSYDIYDEAGNTVFTVQGKLSWGHRLEVSDATGRHIATLQERVLTFLPKFEIYFGDRFAGQIVKEFTLFHPSFRVDFNGWSVKGDFFEWDYRIDSGDKTVATVSKQLFNFTDTYTIDVAGNDALAALLVVLAIDAVKCSRN